MATQAGFIIEGDDEDNELRAKWVRSHSDIQIYNVIYGHGGNDSLVGNDGMKKPATACVAAKNKPCPQKHAGLTHKKTIAGKTEPKKS